MLDAYGVVGQVIHAGLLTSKVMLISDPKSAVPVQDYRNGIRALALGMGSSGKLLLINVPDTSDIQKATSSCLQAWDCAIRWDTLWEW